MVNKGKQNIFHFFFDYFHSFEVESTEENVSVLMNFTCSASLSPTATTVKNYPSEWERSGGWSAERPFRRSHALVLARSRRWTV